MTASGLYVFIKEFKHLLDLTPPTDASHNKYNYQRIYWLVSHIGDADLTALAIGGVSLVIFLGTKFLKRRYPATPERYHSRLFMLWYYLSSYISLIVVVIATGIAYVLIQQGYTIKVLGEIPSGLNAPAAPSVGNYNPGR